MIEMMVVVINDSVIEAINMTSGLLVTNQKLTSHQVFENAPCRTKQTQPANLRGGALK